MKKKRVFSLLAVLCLTLSACASAEVEANITGEVLPAVSVESADSSKTDASSETDVNVMNISYDAVVVDADYEEDDLNAAIASEDTTEIQFDGDMITIMGEGADVQGNVVTISSSGTYQFSGTLNSGQVVIDTQDEGTVSLIFNNVNITSLESAPVYVLNAEKVVITLAENTANSLTDGFNYIYADAETSEPNAALFSNDNLTINGTGLLTINANYKHGIVSNDDLKIVSGNITLNAIADGIKGKDLVVVSDGVVTINTGNDGIQSYNTEDPDKGNVLIEGGQISITSGLDGIQAENTVEISGGEINIFAGGGYVNSTQVIGQGMGQMGGRGAAPPQENNTAEAETAESIKGIKGENALVVSDGIIIIDAADDALHSNGSIVINNGTIQVSSGDDGIHADTAIEINGGEINIISSVEGVESSNIILNDGTVIITAKDDGTNAVADGGTGGEQDDGSQLIVNGGYLQINAYGDGFDSNGDAMINDGAVFVYGHATFGNGAVDVNGTFDINGGYLIAAGSASMAEVPAETSTQNSVAIALENVQSGGTPFRIETSKGEDVTEFTPVMDYQLIVYSSPELETGTSYNIFTGNTQASNFTISSSVTTIGTFDEFMGRGELGGMEGKQRPGGGG